MTGFDGKLAVLFPGQGVGDAAGREPVRALRPDLIALAEKLVGEDPFARIAEGTRFAQPAVYCASLAGYESLDRPAADLFAGHSLGEIAALAAAGAIDDADGLRIVVARGELMDEAASAGAPGGMLAVGGDREQALALAERHGLRLANENSPRQFVLSGPSTGLEAARRDARGLRLRAKRLAVAGAFHTPTMAAAAGPFRQLLDAVNVREPRAPVISCVTAEPFGAEVPELLTAALTSPVRFTDVLVGLHAAGVRRFIDAGPGGVVAGLVKRTLDDVSVEASPTLEPAHA